MKRRTKLITSVAAVCALCATLACATGCSGQQEGQAPAAGQSAPQQVAINQSPDKYTWYVKSYTAPI